MPKRIAVVGAGVIGLTTSVVLREHGYEPVIFADEPTERTTSAVAAAVWFPYEAEPELRVNAWALASYRRFEQLAGVAGSGVTMIEFEVRSARSGIVLPAWTAAVEHRALKPNPQLAYLSGYTVCVPRMDTSVYLPYLRSQLPDSPIRFGRLHDLREIPDEFETIVNCAGYGARSLVPDANVMPHRGQVVIVDPIPGATAFVLDEPLTYVVPREHDCVFGGANSASDSTALDLELTAQIVERCTRMARLPTTPNVREARAGIRPWRVGSVCVEMALLRDGRHVVHNYGHGGCGFTVSWACADEVVALLQEFGRA